MLPREPVRYRQVTQFNIFGTQFVLGATDPNFIRAVWDTIVFAVATVVLELVLGMIVALIVNANFKGRGFMRAIILIPWAIPTAVSSQMWAYMLQPNRTGFLQYRALGIWGLEMVKIPFLSGSVVTVAVYDHDRCLEDDAVYGSAYVSRPAVDPR